MEKKYIVEGRTLRLLIKEAVLHGYKLGTGYGTSIESQINELANKAGVDILEKLNHSEFLSDYKGGKK